MKLDTKEWKEFSFIDLFGKNPPKGTRLTKEDRKAGKIPLVTAGFNNQGISDFINNKEMEIFENCMTIDMFGNCFYRKAKFNADDNILILKNKDFSPYVYLFISTIIMEAKYRQSYGRQYRKKDYYRDLLTLPIIYTTDKNGNKTPKIDPEKKYSKEGYIPDFEYMENYIKSLNYKPLTTSVKKEDKKLELNVDEWKEFKVGNVFKKKKVKKHSKIPSSEGNIPFISSTVENNGIACNCKEKTIKGNCITVTTNGNCFKAFYHEKPIAVSSDVEVLYSDKLNSQNALFVISILDRESFKWSYGRKPKNNAVFETLIKLPICYETDKNGNKTPKIDPEKKYSKEGDIPDFEFMEEYMKQLPYGDRL